MFVNTRGTRVPIAVVVLRGESEGEEILLERQYRHPVKAELWEIPAGLLDIPGEDPRIAAERELAEEADLVADRWDVLVDYFTSPRRLDRAAAHFPRARPSRRRRGIRP